MDIKNANIKTQLKFLMALNQMTMEKLAQKMSEKTGKNYTRAVLYGKINRDSISFTECQLIGEILGYKLEFVEVDR